MDIKLRNVDGTTDAQAAVSVALWFAAAKDGCGVGTGAAVVREGSAFFAYRTKAGMIVVAKA